MNICFISRVFYLGGVSTHLIDLSEELIKSGHKVTIMTAGPAYPQKKENIQLFEEYLNLGVNYVHIDFPVTSTNKFKYLSGLFLSSFKAINILKKEKFDIIHVHTPILSLIPKLAGLNFVRTVHANLASMSIFDIKADKEIAISSELYEFTKKKYKYDGNDIFLIQNGVSYEKLKDINEDQVIDLKEKLNIKKELVISLVGGINFNKGHDILIKSIAKLESNLKSRIKIIFLGDGSDQYISKMKELINQSDLIDRFIFLPFQNPNNIYHISDIVVLPSRKEGYGLVIVEAMLMGCCAIRSNSGGAYDQIESGNTGLLFEVENIDQLTDYLTLVLKDDSLRNNIATSGQQVALDSFTSEKMTLTTLDVYKQLLDI